MKRRNLLTGAAATLAATPLARPHAQKPVTIRWWYHFDDPKATPDELVAAFEKENPGIKVEPENIPWGGGGDYDNRLYTSIIAGNGPDTAMVKFNNLARLMEMDALAPLDKWIDAWPGKSDISADLWRLHTAPDGKRYYMPLQYVVLYLYVRLDLLAKQNLKVPTNFDEFLTAAKALTGGEQWGFGMRGGSGGHDSWMPFVVRHRRQAGEGRVRLAAGAEPEPLLHRPAPGAQGDAAVGADRRLPADRQQPEGRPRGDDGAPHQHRQHDGRDVRRRDHRGAGAARAERRRLRDVRRRFHLRVQREQEPRGGVAVDLLAVHRRRTTCCTTRRRGR